MEFPQHLIANESTRAGRMLAAGDVRVTVTDYETDEHITVRFKTILDNREVDGHRPEPGQQKNWLRAELSRATHVFLEVPSAGGTYPDKIGTFYPRTGRFFPDRSADPVRVNAAILVALWLNLGDDEGVVNGAEQYGFQEEAYCGKCGRQLTDPVSIERGIGPECFGRETGSQHQVKVKDATRMTDRDWTQVQYSVQNVLDIISDMSDDDQERVRHELNMWSSQRRQSTQEQLFQR